MIKFQYWMAGTIWDAFRMVTNMLQPEHDIFSDEEIPWVPTKYDKSLKMSDFIIKNNCDDFMIDEEIVEDLKKDLDEIIAEYECYKRDTCMSRVITNARYMIECILKEEEWKHDHFCNYKYKPDSI